MVVHKVSDSSVWLWLCFSILQKLEAYYKTNLVRRWEKGNRGKLREKTKEESEERRNEETKNERNLIGKGREDVDASHV